MTEIEKMQKKNKKNNLGKYVYFLFMIIFWIFLIYIFLYSKKMEYNPDKSLIVEYDLSKDLLPEPIQKEIPKEIVKTKINGVNVIIEKLASYDITGKVEAIEEYSTSFIASKLGMKSDGTAVIDKISPRDLTLSWGEIALEENNNNIYCKPDYTAKRIVNIGFNSKLLNKYDKNKILTHVSNNHVITLNSGLKRVLMSVKENQIVRIKGYLVYVKTDDGTVWGPSSLTRSDTGNGACEIVLADEIIIMSK